MNTDTRAAEIAALLTRLTELITPREPATMPAPRPTPERVLLTVEEAAQRLRIGRTRMFALLKTGVVESVLIGRLRRIPVDAINAYAANLLAGSSTF